MLSRGAVSHGPSKEANVSPLSRSARERCMTCWLQTRAATARALDDSLRLVPDLRLAADHGDYDIESWADSA